MDLLLTDEQAQLQSAARRLLAARLDGLEERLPEPPVADARQARADAVALGWLGLGLPEPLGGAGTFDDLVVVHEELGRGLAPSLTAAATAAGRLLLRCPAGPTRDRLLADLAAGVAIPVTCALEPGARETIARASWGGAGLLLSGPVGPFVDARSADTLLVPVERDGRTALVAVGSSTVVLLPAEQGMSDVPSHRVELDRVTVPADAVLATDAEPVVAAARTDAIVLAASRAVGSGRAVLQRSIDHVRTRRQFDRAIGTFQAVQHQLADVATALDAAGLAVARAAWAIDCAPDQADRAAAVAGLAASAAASDATLVAHQLHGGMGFVLDSPLHLWSARAVADPTVPATRRELLELLATADGLPADGRVRLPAQHRTVFAPAR